MIPTRMANSSHGRSSSDQQQQQKEKRQKTSEDVVSPNVSQSAPSKTVRTSPEKGGGNLSKPRIDLTDAATKAAIRHQFSPSYTMPDGRVLLLNDSVKEEPNPAVSLLRGLALPRDYDQVPTDLLPDFGEMCSHLVQAGKAALKAYDKASKVSAERQYRSDRDSYHTKWRISEQQAKDAEAEVKKLKKELADARDAAKTAEAEARKLKEEEREKMWLADAKGYEAGIKRAALKYTKIAHKIVNDELEVRLPDFYRLGYAAGADAIAGVMAIQPESEFLRQLPEPEVPSLDLPYTEEECLPLPLEDDDEEMIEADHQQGRVEEHAGEASNREGSTDAHDKVAKAEEVQIN
ncbi:hypothetical protein RHSIM_RhsimUnG0136200 [Rhododendron simsii]|uniref:Uncharacterized protein n=1 Tax=Rhododendron simsii TaxID=118357 RepID=A0A834FV68_RHOSS|nr:hypothetical protein RHSIM_RhsimUnG0136200 [Rhododendron simsii]